MYRYFLAIIIVASYDSTYAQTDIEQSSDVEQLAAEAETQYKQGKYEEAIATYLKAYQISSVSALLYNIAYIYDHKLHEVDLALDFYRRFVKSQDADPEMVARATQRINELKTRKESLEDKPTTPREPSVTKKRKGIAPIRIAGWATLGGGVVLLGTGLVFGIIAKKTQEDFESEGNLSKKLDLRDTGKKQALAADILMSVGSAAVVGGIVMLFLPERLVGNARVTPVLTNSGGVIEFGTSW